MEIGWIAIVLNLQSMTEPGPRILALAPDKIVLMDAITHATAKGSIKPGETIVTFEFRSHVTVNQEFIDDCKTLVETMGIIMEVVRPTTPSA